MAHYGSGTAKRHYLYSNSPHVRFLDKGRLVGWKRVAEHKQSARRYRDRKGVKRYVGTKNLRNTESFGCSFDFWNMSNSYCKQIAHMTIYGIRYIAKKYRVVCFFRSLTSLNIHRLVPVAQDLSLVFCKGLLGIDGHHEENGPGTTWVAGTGSRCFGCFQAGVEYFWSVGLCWPKCVVSISPEE